jgi:hypothetical protein
MLKVWLRDDDDVLGEVVLRRRRYRGRLGWYGSGSAHLDGVPCRWHARIVPMTTTDDYVADADQPAVLRDVSESEVERIMREVRESEAATLEAVMRDDAEVSKFLEGLARDTS